MSFFNAKTLFQRKNAKTPRSHSSNLLQQTPNSFGGPPCPPILGGKAFGSPRIGGQGGAPGAIETILTAWLSSYK